MRNTQDYITFVMVMVMVKVCNARLVRKIS